VYSPDPCSKAQRCCAGRGYSFIGLICGMSKNHDYHDGFGEADRVNYPNWANRS
jgi:hypothetical protein